MQGLVAATGGLHCVKFQKRECCFSECLAITAMRLAMKRRFFRYTWALGLVFGGRRVGFVLLDPVHIQASCLQAVRFAHCWGSQHPDTEPLGHVLRAQRRVARGLKARKNQSLWCVQTSDFRARFVIIHLQKKRTGCQKCCLRNHAKDDGTSRVVGLAELDFGGNRLLVTTLIGDQAVQTRHGDQAPLQSRWHERKNHERRFQGFA